MSLLRVAALRKTCRSLPPQRPASTRSRALTPVAAAGNGQIVNPHLFRKIPPTELAIRDPEHVGIARPLLGHADYRVTQEYYNLGRAVDAAGQYNAVVESIRAGCISTPRARHGHIGDLVAQARDPIPASRPSSRKVRR
jgi:integrase